mmetsp:Transcript_19671/g.75547  ORF Transcript_19671/g.75547 Transcript_19671/m.75547 type:complete len:258 (-) Transcript_19671:468-1241(-)
MERAGDVGPGLAAAAAHSTSSATHSARALASGLPWATAFEAKVAAIGWVRGRLTTAAGKSAASTQSRSSAAERRVTARPSATTPNLMTRTAVLAAISAARGVLTAPGGSMRVRRVAASWEPCTRRSDCDGDSGSRSAPSLPTRPSSKAAAPSRTAAWGVASRGRLGAPEASPAATDLAAALRAVPAASASPPGTRDATAEAAASASAPLTTPASTQRSSRARSSAASADSALRSGSVGATATCAGCPLGRAHEHAAG